MKKFLKSIKGFTLIEVSMAIALVAIGLTVGILGYNGYQSWATTNAAAENSQNLANAVAQYKALGGDTVALNTALGATNHAAVTKSIANAVYAVIADTTTNGLPSGVHIVPTTFVLPATAAFNGTVDNVANSIVLP